MHDVFISYEHESKSIADNIVNALESNKIRCWYAPRDVVGDYATSICTAISESKIFVLVLNENSSNSDHCLNEVEMAYMANMEKNHSIIIMPFKVDNKSLNKAMEYYVKRLHWIDATTNSLENAINELLSKIASILNISLEGKCDNLIIKDIKDRHANKYIEYVKYEQDRLAKQSEISKQFDQPIYDKLVIGKDNLTVLDIGAGNGTLIIDRLGAKSEVSKIIGLEFNQSAVDYANNIGCSKAKFFQCDLESSDFEEKLKKILHDNDIEKIDFINMSMIVLHLSNPFSVLKILRKYIHKDGIILVKDIDDGLNIAYPDPNGYIEKTVKICLRNEDSGYRLSGRQVFNYLKLAGFTDIKMEKIGLTTIELDYDGRQALFDTYFEFVLGDLELMANKYKNNKEVQEDLKWLREEYLNIESMFLQDNFFFNLGFMLFSGKR